MKCKMEITVDGMDVAVRVLRPVIRVQGRVKRLVWETVFRSQADEDATQRIRHAYFEGWDPKSLNGMEGRIVMATTIGWEKMRVVARNS